MKEVELSKEDILFLNEKLKRYKFTSIFGAVFIMLLYLGFYFLNFHKESFSNIDGFGIFIELIFLSVLTYALIKSFERNRNLKQNLLIQKKILGYFKVLEKEITNKNERDSSSHCFIKVFSEIQNKHKYIFLNQKDYNIIEVNDSVYIEYFTDSNLIKILELKNKKLEYIRYQIYDTTFD